MPGRKGWGGRRCREASDPCQGGGRHCGLPDTAGAHAGVPLILLEGRRGATCRWISHCQCRPRGAQDRRDRSHLRDNQDIRRVQECPVHPAEDSLNEHIPSIWEIFGSFLIIDHCFSLNTSHHPLVAERYRSIHETTAIAPSTKPPQCK